MTGTPRARPRGNITPLPSGSLRVRVYAGTDSLTGKANYLTETVKPGPKAAARRRGFAPASSARSMNGSTP